MNAPRRNARSPSQTEVEPDQSASETLENPFAPVRKCTTASCSRVALSSGSVPMRATCASGPPPPNARAQWV